MPTVIHLDDDHLMRMLWKKSSYFQDKKLRSFGSPAELKEDLKSIPHDATFYIDSALGEKVQKGEDLALELFELGFRELYLTTGHDIEDFPKMPWIKGVLGKRPPK